MRHADAKREQMVVEEVRLYLQRTCRICRMSQNFTGEAGFICLWPGR